MPRLSDSIRKAGRQLLNGLHFHTMSAGNLPVHHPCNVPGKICFSVWRTLFEVDDIYEPIKAIGRGAYGVVCSARNKRTGEKVAIKKVGNIFGNLVDARRALREMTLLRHLRHENVIAVLDIMAPPAAQAGKFADIYLVYELMDTDLHQIIRSPQPLSDEHAQYFIYQLLRGLKYIHSANVLHRDLKPSNLLLNANCDLKICDFGLARTGAETSFMTEYVVTRWYRAPELLLSNENYSAAIDIWSVGCIMAELLLRQPLFKGSDYLDQLRRIIGFLGRPAEAELDFIASSRARAFVRTLEGRPVDWAAKFPGAHPRALDLMARMLQFNPGNRITVEQALAHPYMAQLHDIEMEPSAPEEFKFDFEEERLDEPAVRQLVWTEMCHYHPEIRQQPVQIRVQAGFFS